MTAETARRWPVDLARTQLLYGERLRRARATSEARSHLTAAFDTFRRLGATPWAHRAQQELRAAGHTGTPAVPAAKPAEVLTPQQLQIAEMAATGLTTKQIGQRLYLSHRTVGTHLYQIFPKLGITSRAALRDVLRGVESPSEAEDAETTP